MSIMENKKVVVMGVRNKWSIAWGITKQLYSQGAKLILTYLGDREKDSIVKLIEGMEGIELIKCDITSDDEIKSTFEYIGNNIGKIDGLVHAIAHANAEDLKNDFVYTTRDGFSHALEVSAYSLVAVTREAKEIMNEGASIITLTYLGADKVLPGYNVMGVAKAALEASVRYLANDMGAFRIRVNAISAGPVKTLSAKGVKSFSSVLDRVVEKAPLKKNVTLEELGNSAVYLLSDLSKGVTGQILYVDSGYCIMGM